MQKKRKENMSLKTRRYRLFCLVICPFAAYLIILCSYIKTNDFEKTTSQFKTKIISLFEGNQRNNGKEGRLGFEYLTENEALHYPPCRNTQEANISAVLELTGKRPSYRIGETVLLKFTLYDGNGNVRAGGDKILVSMENTHLGAYSSGTVTDLRNGSYLAAIDILWKGDIKIMVWVLALREVIAAMLRVMKQLRSTRHTVAIFKGELSREETLCDVTVGNLQSKTGNYTSYPQVCNFTYLNSGEPWYCGHPKQLMCDDWMFVTARDYPFKNYPVNNCEMSLLTQESLTGKVLKEIDIIGEGEGQALVQTQCSKVNKEELWKMKTPTGYFYNNTWNLRHCKGIEAEGILLCIRNKNIYLFGDSTVRHWFTDIASRFKCVLNSEKSSSHAHKPMQCKNDKLNFKVMLCSHNQPFNVGSTHNESNTYTLYSISRRLDDISSNENAIILINLFAHLVQYHESVYEMKVAYIRQGIERLMKRNPFVKVLIKMPHIYFKTRAYFGFRYIDIWYKEMEGLHNRVVFLDNIDATIATRNVDIHPPAKIVTAMVNQMFSYACDENE